MKAVIYGALGMVAVCAVAWSGWTWLQFQESDRIITESSEIYNQAIQEGIDKRNEQLELLERYKGDPGGLALHEKLESERIERERQRKADELLELQLEAARKSAGR